MGYASDGYPGKIRVHRLLRFKRSEEVYSTSPNLVERPSQHRTVAFRLTNNALSSIINSSAPERSYQPIPFASLPPEAFSTFGCLRLLPFRVGQTSIGGRGINSPD